MERESEIRSKIMDSYRTVSTARNTSMYYFSKRVLDIVFSLFALILLSPFMLFIALLIILDSPGPIIYKQKRVGSKRHNKNGLIKWEQTDFSFYKFRTMVNHSDSSIHRSFIKALIDHDEEKAQILKNSDDQTKKLTNDPRVTRLGHILRRSSLDELPQFWNVLKGDMSLVGPRPAIPYEVEVYKPWYFSRFNSTPGLTGYWQVTARNSVGFDEMVKLDIEYIDKQSMWLDLKIILMTPITILLHRGAA